MIELCTVFNRLFGFYATLLPAVVVPERGGVCVVVELLRWWSWNEWDAMRWIDKCVHRGSPSGQLLSSDFICHHPDPQSIHFLSPLGLFRVGPW